MQSDGRSLAADRGRGWPLSDSLLRVVAPFDALTVRTGLTGTRHRRKTLASFAAPLRLRSVQQRPSQARFARS